jgi:hypothetical protein
VSDPDVLSTTDTTEGLDDTARTRVGEVQRAPARGSGGGRLGVRLLGYVDSACRRSAARGIRAGARVTAAYEAEDGNVAPATSGSTSATSIVMRRRRSGKHAIATVGAHDSPFGPYVAACLAAGEVFRAIRTPAAHYLPT